MVSARKQLQPESFINLQETSSRDLQQKHNINFLSALYMLLCPNMPSYLHRNYLRKFGGFAAIPKEGPILKGCASPRATDQFNNVSPENKCNYFKASTNPCNFSKPAQNQPKLGFLSSPLFIPLWPLVPPSFLW